MTAASTMRVAGRSVTCPGRGHPLVRGDDDGTVQRFRPLMPYADPEKKKAFDAAYYQANKARMRAANEQWKREHREEHLQSQRDWYNRNRERIRAETAAAYAANPEPAKARTRQWAKDNPERKRESLRMWSKTAAGRALSARARERDREKRRAAAREYWRKLRISNPEKVREASHRNQSVRRARILGAPEVERVDRRVVFKRDDYVCQICGESTIIDGDEGDRPSVDHIIPLSRGGSHTYANVQTAHLNCNRYKHAKVAD